MARPKQAWCFPKLALKWPDPLPDFWLPYSTPPHLRNSHGLLLIFCHFHPPALSRWDTATLALRPGHRLALPVQKGLLLPSGPAGTRVSFLCKAISGLEDGRTSSSAVSGAGIGPCRLGKLAVTGKTTEGEGISDCDRGSGGGGIFPAVASVSQHVPAKTPPMPQTEGMSVGRSENLSPEGSARQRPCAPKPPVAKPGISVTERPKTAAWGAAGQAGALWVRLAGAWAPKQLPRRVESDDRFAAWPDLPWEQSGRRLSQNFGIALPAPSRSPPHNTCRRSWRVCLSCRRPPPPRHCPALPPPRPAGVLCASRGPERPESSGPAPTAAAGGFPQPGFHLAGRPGGREGSQIRLEKQLKCLRSKGRKGNR